MEKIEEKRWGRWLKLKSAADYVGVSVNTFRTYFLKSGELRPAITDFGKRYDKEMIDQILLTWTD